MIGTACAAMVLLNGRVIGVSGIFSSALALEKGASWRWSFLGGVIVAASIAALLYPAGFVDVLGRGAIPSLVGGVLVGVGTQLGGGCTSGHGVCGIGRLSQRSMVATVVFIAAGMATVALLGSLLKGVA